MLPWAFIKQFDSWKETKYFYKEKNKEVKVFEYIYNWYGILKSGSLTKFVTWLRRKIIENKGKNLYDFKKWFI